MDGLTRSKSLLHVEGIFAINKGMFLIKSAKNCMFSCWKTANIHQRLGASHPAADELLRFSHKKTLVLAHFFNETGHAMSAVTMDNLKIFSQQERIWGWGGGGGHCAML